MNVNSWWYPRYQFKFEFQDPDYNCIRYRFIDIITNYEVDFSDCKQNLENKVTPFVEDTCYTMNQIRKDTGDKF